MGKLLIQAAQRQTGAATLLDISVDAALLA